MEGLQRRAEDIGRVNLTKDTSPKAESKPQNGQVVPEGVKKVGDFGVLHEDTVYIAPKPLFSGKRKGKVW